MAIGVQLNQDPSILTSAVSMIFIATYLHENSSSATGIFRRYVLTCRDSQLGTAGIEIRRQPITVRTPEGSANSMPNGSTQRKH